MGKIICYILLILIGFICFCLTCFIFGFCPIVKAQNLKEEDALKIRQFGISHKTTSKGKVGIKKDNKIKGSKFVKAYSTHFRKAVFFFANAYIKDGEDFNNNLKYEYNIKISNLSEKQIQNFKIREYDKVLMYNGDIVIEEQNVIQIESIKKERNKKIDNIIYFVKGIFSNKIDQYVKELYVSLLKSLIVLIPLLVIWVFLVIKIYNF